MREWFTRLARKVSDAAGHPYAFLAGLVLIVGWALCGPMFGWSDSHSLFVNTATTICTFLMVFLIQNAQNRGQAALQAKIDELLLASERANNTLVAIEDDTDEALEAARRSVADRKEC
jgi:low affinity Fe/Cu permease